MKPKHSFRNLLLLSGSIMLTLSAANADTLYWDGGTVDILTDGNGLSGGTAGNWDTTLLNWDAGASPHVAWDNSGLDTAVFGGTAGTVTLTAPITVGGLQFNTTGYTVAAGSNGLSFGADSTVNLYSVAAASITGSIGSTASNMTFSALNPFAAGTVTFGGTNTTGWSGTTTINAGMTLAAEGSTGNRALGFTSGITLNGGSITTGSGVTSANNTVNFFNDSAAITVNGGGSISYRPINAGPTFLENIGAVTVNSGQMSFATGTVSSGSATLAMPSITRATTTSNLIFSTGNGGALVDGNFNKIQVSGSGTTSGWVSGATSNPIIGSWATTGTGSGADYAVYSGNNVVSANTIASAETNWTDDSKQYTLTNAPKSSTTLTGTRNITALRSTSTATALTAVDIGTETITVTAHSYANGDVVSFGGTPPAGLATGTVYYVIGATADTFQVAATSGGAAINLTGTGSGPNVTGGIKLTSGNNLGTTGILNSSAASLAIGSDGVGAVTLPSTTSGNLFLNAAGAGIAINAPITNNGAGVLTLVKTGAGSAFLSGSNTFTGGIVNNAGTTTLSGANTFGTGAFTIAGGNITASTTASWGGAGRNVTFTGTGSLNSTVDGYTGGTLTVEANAVGQISSLSSLAFATTTGSGTIRGVGGANKTLNLGDAGTFTGNVELAYNANNNSGVGTSHIQFSDLSDTVGSSIKFYRQGGGTDSGQVGQIALAGDAGSLTFDNRQIQLLPRTGGSGQSMLSNYLLNNNATAANHWVINTDLLNQYDRAHNFILGGGNLGENQFDGSIGNSINGSFALSLQKAGTGKWIVSGDNTYTGSTTISGGTLEVKKLADGNSNSSIGASSNAAGNLLLANGTTLRYTGDGDSTDRSFTLNVGTAGHGATLDASGSDAISFTNTATPAYGTNNQTRTLTLRGTNTDANTLAANIDNNGSGLVSIVKNDGGTWVLSGDNAYDGTTTVTAGTLLINGNSSTAVGAVTVAAAGTLGGIGTVGGTTALNGTLSPGQSPGTLTFAGDLNVNNGATYFFEGGDLTNVTATLDLNDNWTLALGTGFMDGGSVTIFNFGTLAVSPDLVPTFNDTLLGFTPSGGLTLSVVGNSVVLNGISFIPEPSTALLGALGALMLLRRRR